MREPASRSEHLVLVALEDDDGLSMESLVSRLPELTWNEVFHAVDALSRRGDIRLRRRGFDYYLSLPRITMLSA